MERDDGSVELQVGCDKVPPEYGKVKHVKFSGRTVTAVVLFPDQKVLLVKRGTVPFKG